MEFADVARGFDRFFGFHSHTINKNLDANKQGNNFSILDLHGIQGKTELTCYSSLASKEPTTRNAMPMRVIVPSV
jgi:hypothetical protein